MIAEDHRCWIKIEFLGIPFTPWMVWNPKSLPAAAAIFLSGCAAIAFTTLDIQRTLRSNDEPMTLKQMKVLEEMLDHHKDKSAGEAPKKFPFVKSTF